MHQFRFVLQLEPSWVQLQRGSSTRLTLQQTT